MRGVTLGLTSRCPEGPVDLLIELTSYNNYTSTNVLTLWLLIKVVILSSTSRFIRACRFVCVTVQQLVTSPGRIIHLN